MRPASVLLLTMLLALLMFGSARRPQVAAAAPGDITTLAGGGVGDGGGAAAAAVSPHGITADGAGNLYIADAANCRVRKLTPGGTVSTVAGTGTCGFAGDGGPATSARLAFPQAVAVATAGDLYIADAGNCRVRRVDTAGVITTFAGTGLCIFGGDGGPPAAAFLANPSGIAVSAAGDVFIADSDNCRVRRVAAGVITTIAGTGSCGFLGDGGPATAAHISHVTGLFDDGAGNLYIADTDVCRVRVITPGGIIGTLAGDGACGYGGDGGAAWAAPLNRPRAIAAEPSGDILIADTENCRVRRVDFPTVTISTVAGTGTCGFAGDAGPPAAAALNQPRGVAVAGGATYIADSDNCRLRRATGGVIASALGTGWCRYGGDGGPAANAALFNPGESAVDAAGNLYIADTGNCRVRRVDPAGAITTFAGNGACAYSGDGGPPTAAALNGPRSVAVDAAGAVLIADSNNCRIRRVAGGVIMTFAGTGTCGFGGDGGPAAAATLTYPQGVAVFGATVYVADTFACRIRHINAGTISTLAGDGACTFDGDGGPPAAASLTFPYSVAAGPSGVIIADTYNCRVRRVAGGTIATIAGTGTCGFGGEGGPAAAASLNRPLGVALDAGGAVYIADTDNCRVRLISGTTIVAAAGIGTGVAGFGCDFAGDSGVATAARLDHPSAVTLGAAGDLFISDTGNGRVRRVAAGADGDGDGIPDAADNCAATANGGQTNADGNVIDLPAPIAFDDLTRPHSDAAGDACDADDDNDGLGDAAEPAGCNGSGPLGAANPDTDGDRVLDNAECLLGSNPAAAASVPPLVVAPDADSDGVPDVYDPNDASIDSDGDGALDRWEFRHYNTALNSANTDADTCGDAREVASVNADQIVNSGDLGTIASRFGPGTSAGYVAAFDVNKDGNINSGDLGFVASKFGPCP